MTALIRERGIAISNRKLGVVFIATGIVFLSMGLTGIGPQVQAVSVTDDYLATIRGLGDASRCCKLSGPLDSCEGDDDGCEAQQVFGSGEPPACDADGTVYFGTRHVCGETGTTPELVCDNATVDCWKKYTCVAGEVDLDEQKVGHGCLVNPAYNCRPCDFGSSPIDTGASVEDDDCVTT